MVFISHNIKLANIHGGHYLTLGGPSSLMVWIKNIKFYPIDPLPLKTFSQLNTFIKQKQFNFFLNTWGSLRPSLNASASAVHIHHSNFAQARFCLFLRIAFEDLTVQQTGHCIYKASIKSVILVNGYQVFPYLWCLFYFPTPNNAFSWCTTHRPLCQPLILPSTDTLARYRKCRK